MQPEKEYDLFERLPDGAPIWRGRALGLLEAKEKLAKIAESTKNECFVMYLPTKEIIRRVNAAESTEPRQRAHF